jgi:CelD/BcsL family acetyltransferase involved in cellulose biosynthesis
MMIEPQPVASRHGASVHVEWRAPVAIDDATLAAWSALPVADANVFAEPWMVRPALDAFAATANGAVIALVRECDRLIGVAPLARTRPGRLPVDACALWTHHNAFLGAAAAAAGEEARFWGALIDSLPASPPASRLAAPMIAAAGIVADSALHRGLIAAAAQRDLPLDEERRTVRAMLATDLPPDAYWDSAVRAKKRKELRRQWARLNEEGVLATDRLTADADIAPWIEEFLALELAGWKGANGSALASQADTTAFFRAALAQGHALGRVAFTALRLDGRAIAMLVTLMSGGAGYSFKTAFDEAYARYSPGVLLQRESLSLLAEQRLAFIDSCAAQDHPMIDSLWRERRTVLTLTLPQPGALNRLIYRGTTAATRGWHMVKRVARAPAKDQESAA